MKFTAPIILFVTAAPTALGQIGSYTFDVSTDGNSWNNSVTVAAGTVVHARLRASWSGIFGTSLGYAGAQFDVTLQGASPLSSVSAIQRPFPFNFGTQTFAAIAYAQGIKIDDVQDLDAPGVGTRWINPGQLNQLAAPPDTYNSNNPCTIFTFDVLAFDSMRAGLVLNTGIGRAMVIYTDGEGHQQRLNSTEVSLTSAFINIPAPGSLIALSFSVAVVRQRIRPTRRIP